ncbi:WXG100 family type VII secretion target [Nonomuraea sp. NPDC002799]
MSVYKEMYWTAGGMAALATALIRSGWTFYITSAIGSMISDPEGMEGSAKQTLTTVKNGLTVEFEEIDKLLVSLKTQLKEQGTWEGEAFEAFEQVHTSFRDSLKQLEDSRNATGEGLESSAAFWKVGAIVCASVAAVMLTLGIAKAASNLGGPIGKAAAWTAETVIAKTIIKVMEKVFGKHLLAIGALGGIMYAANAYADTAGKVFPTLKAMPTEMGSMTSLGGKPFTNDGMIYDKDLGALTPKRELPA